MKALDVRKALYGLHYDLGEKLRQQDADVLEWLERKMKSLRNDIAYHERQKEYQRKYDKKR